MQKKAFFFKNIWSYQKKAVPLQPISKMNHVFLAQLVEQLTLNQWVQGSSPWEDTKRQIAENVQFTRNVYCTFFRIYMPIISRIGAIHTRFGTLSAKNLLQNCNKSVTQTQIGNKIATTTKN